MYPKGIGGYMKIHDKIEGIIFIFFIFSAIVIGCVSAETQERDRREWARIDIQFAQSEKERKGKIKRKKEITVIDSKYDIVIDQETALPIEVLRGFESRLDPKVVLEEWTQLMLVLSSEDTIVSYFGNPKLDWAGVDPKNINIEDYPVPEGDITSFVSVSILLLPESEKGRLVGYGYFNKNKEMRTFRFEKIEEEKDSYRYFNPEPFIKRIFRDKAKSKGGLDT